MFFNIFFFHISLMRWDADSLSYQGAHGREKGFIASGINSCCVSFRGSSKVEAFYFWFILQSNETLRPNE